MVASVFSSQQPAFAGFAPVNVNPPVVSGGGLVGEQLTCDPGVWKSEPHDPTFTYQWKRNGTNIPGATNSTYTSVDEDLGQEISCTVTATNPDGSKTVTSNSVTVGGAPVNETTPHVSGDTKTGSQLSVTNGTWKAYPEPTYTYQWKRSGLAISGATNNTYTTTSDDEGVAITCTVTATNFFGNASADSNAVGPIEPPLSAPVNTTAPVASGNAVVTQQVDCGNGIWDANPDPTYTYQWQRDQVDIPGATSSTYNVTAEDIGAMLRVVVTATNSEGSAAAHSNEMGPVASTLQGFTITAGENIQSGDTGYSSGSYGSIDQEPLPDATLQECATRTSDYTQVAISGNVVKAMTGKVPVIPGVTLSTQTEAWTYHADQNYTQATWDSTGVMTVNQTYAVTWADA